MKTPENKSEEYLKGWAEREAALPSEEEIYDMINKWLPGDEFNGCYQCQALKGCRAATCPQFKTAMARLISVRIKK